MSKMWGLHDLTPEEMEFLAEDQLQTVVPLVSHDIFHLIQGDFGPLRPPLPCDVPLWLAVALKKRNMAKMACPGWMAVENLEEVLKVEKETKDSNDFAKNLPFHFQEIASMILAEAAEDMPEPERIRTLLADIASLRTEKLHQVMIRAGVSDLIKIDKNLGSMELIPVRKIFGTLLSEDYDIFVRDREEATQAAEMEALYARERAAEENERGDGEVPQVATPARLPAAAEPASSRTSGRLRRFRK